MQPLFVIVNHWKMKFSELYRMLERDGWYIKRTNKHHYYVHPHKSGRVAVGKHVSKEVPTGTLQQIIKMAGLKNQGRSLKRYL